MLALIFDSADARRRVPKMKDLIKRSILICVILALVLLTCNCLLAQGVAIYYDPAKGTAWIDPAQMAPAVEKELGAKGIECQIVNAEVSITRF